MNKQYLREYNRLAQRRHRKQITKKEFERMKAALRIAYGIKRGRPPMEKKREGAQEYIRVLKGDIRDLRRNHG